MNDDNMLREHRNQLEVAPPGQTEDNLSIKTNNDNINDNH